LKHKHSHVSKDETRHGSHLEEMFEHPHRYFPDLERDVFVAKEGRFYSGQNIVAEPDITIYQPRSHTIYLVEYKLRDHLRNKARHQLSVEELLMNEYFPNYKVEKFYIHNNFEEELWK